MVILINFLKRFKIICNIFDTRGGVKLFFFENVSQEHVLFPNYKIERYHFVEIETIGRSI